MQAFARLTGVAAPLPMANVDTDKIIPAKWLKTIKRTELGVALFEPLRWDADGSERPDFILNRTPYRKAKILIVGENFGCGSSREHTAWALLDFGIRCVIATSFADLFFNNCIENGILPIVLPKEEVETLMGEAAQAKDPTYTVDLEQQEIVRPTRNKVFRFNFASVHRNRLLNGIDQVSLTMQKRHQIDRFEAGQKASQPWLYHGPA